MNQLSAGPFLFRRQYPGNAIQEQKAPKIRETPSAWTRVLAPDVSQINPPEGVSIVDDRPEGLSIRGANRPKALRSWTAPPEGVSIRKYGSDHPILGATSTFMNHREFCGQES
jgi:hypothetical protein